MARFVNKKGYPIKWKENDQRNFSVEELRKAEETYSPSQFGDLFAKMKKDREKDKVAAVAPVAPVVAKAPSSRALEDDDDEAGSARQGKKQFATEEVDPTAARDAKAAALCAAMDKLLAGRADTTKLHLAVEHKLQPATECIIKLNKFEVKKQDGDGNTPLHIAAIVTNHPGAKA